MASSSSQSSAARPIEERRIYVGNLALQVNEHALIQLFTKYGKITKLDFLFHKVGPMKGKPRGYAFVEFQTKEEAMRAISSLDGKSFCGKTLSLSLAQKTAHPETYPQGGHRVGQSGRRSQSEVRTTTLSLIKNAQKPQGTHAKIYALEAKLATMRRDDPFASSSAPSTSMETLSFSPPIEALASTSKTPEGSATPTEPSTMSGEADSTIGASHSPLAGESATTSSSSNAHQSLQPDESPSSSFLSDVPPSTLGEPSVSKPQISASLPSKPSTSSAAPPSRPSSLSSSRFPTSLPPKPYTLPFPHFSSSSSSTNASAHQATTAIPMRQPGSSSSSSLVGGEVIGGGKVRDKRPNPRQQITAEALFRQAKERKAREKAAKGPPPGTYRA